MSWRRLWLIAEPRSFRLRVTGSHILTFVDLPDDLALPLRSGRDNWFWLGGRPAMDLVNTLRERWWREVETLVSAGREARCQTRRGCRLTRKDDDRNRAEGGRPEPGSGDQPAADPA